MSILKEYVKGDIKNNRKSYNSTRITIFLAVVILSTFLFGVFSYFKSFLDMPDSNMGGSHFRIISEISNKDANNLVLNKLELKRNDMIQKIEKLDKQIDKIDEENTLLMNLCRELPNINKEIKLIKNE